MKFTVVDDATGEVLFSGTCQDASALGAPGQRVLPDVAHAPGGWVDLTGEYRAIPPKPSRKHAWDWAARVWVDPRTAEQALREAWSAAREVRNAKLAASDWVRLRADDLGQPMPAEWTAYRQALRDITNQPDPLNIAWPAAPTQSARGIDDLAASTSI